jgi:hypothetical protein
VGRTRAPGCIRVSEDEISELVIKLPLASRHTVCLPLPPRPSLTVAPEVVGRSTHTEVLEKPVQMSCCNGKFSGGFWAVRTQPQFVRFGPVAVYSCDVSGVIRDLNNRAAELWVANRNSLMHGALASSTAEIGADARSAAITAVSRESPL